MDVAGCAGTGQRGTAALLRTETRLLRRPQEAALTLLLQLQRRYSMFSVLWCCSILPCSLGIADSRNCHQLPGLGNALGSCISWGS